MNMPLHTVHLEFSEENTLFVFRLSSFSSAFSFQTAPPSGLLSPCPWTGPAVWHVSFERINKNMLPTKFLNSRAFRVLQIYTVTAAAHTCDWAGPSSEGCKRKDQASLFSLHLLFLSEERPKNNHSELQLTTRTTSQSSYCSQTHLWFVIGSKFLAMAEGSVDTWTSSCVKKKTYNQYDVF